MATNWASWEKDWNRNWRKARKALRSDRLLRQAGLERRSDTSDFFGGLGLFALGILVGAGLGLMFAPKRGEEMRGLMSDAWKSRRGHEEMPGLGADATPSPAGGM